MFQLISLCVVLQTLQQTASNLDPCHPCVKISQEVLCSHRQELFSHFGKNAALIMAFCSTMAAVYFKKPSKALIKM